MWRRKTTPLSWCTSHDRPLDSDGRCEADKELEERMDKRKFKVGDRVKVVDAAGASEYFADDLVDGDLGTVIDVLPNEYINRRNCPYRVKFDRSVHNNDPYFMARQDLELVHRPTTFKLDGVNLSSYETVALEELVDVLNPDDPFERVIMDMVATNRRKRADYAVDGSPWSNFDDTANALGIPGFTPVDSVNFNIEQKSARLRSLRKNGRMQDPRNESVTDTYLDRAVYSVIALAMHTYPTGKVEATEDDAA